VVGIFAGINRRVAARLVLVGDGPDRTEAADEARRLGVGDRVVFLGKQDSVAELLSCADLFLLPSESESFGLAALEAMASGVPVVATCTGGIPEVVEHGVTGFLAEVGDVDGMAEAGIELLRDSARWAAASLAAEALAAERFAANVVVPRYEAYYRKVVGER
jgi:L-malate glycosyltransferase